LVRFAVPRIYLIGSIAELPAPLLRQFAAAARKAGVRFAVQLRDKPASDRDLYVHAKKLAPLVPLYVNGRPHVAEAAGATGVHLGLATLPVDTVRRSFPGLQIGYSAHNARELAEAAQADFTVLSPFAKPLSKPDDTRRPLGPAGFARIASKSPVPVLALGGITPDNAPLALHSWAEGVAVKGVILLHKNPLAAFRSLIISVRGDR